LNKNEGRDNRDCRITEAGFTADTPQLGWSMTKSVLNALVGIRIKQGKLSLDQNASDFIAEWKNDNVRFLSALPRFYIP
jgi:CubicO group peptidase (beta-lactamase class C family)